MIGKIGIRHDLTQFIGEPPFAAHIRYSLRSKFIQ